MKLWYIWWNCLPWCPILVLYFGCFEFSEDEVVWQHRWGGWNSYLYPCHLFLSLTVKSALKSADFYEVRHLAPFYRTQCIHIFSQLNTHTHTHPFNGPFPRLPRWAGTRKVKPIWILLKQETVSGSGICKSAPRSRQITTPTPHHSVFYRPDALPAAQPTVSKHWRHLK